MLNKNEKISVVMTTYNGEKYLVEQLDSIRKQTIQPDEVIICDDCSTDKTWTILNDYKHKYELNTWGVFRNECNVGWKENFYNALKKSTGDIIFLSDQDDVWLPDKIEKCFEVMKGNKEIELLTSGYDFLINGEVELTKYTKETVNRYKFNKRFFHNQKPGAVYAFRRVLLEEAISYWNKNLPHDAQLWLIAMVRGTLYEYNKSLILYRRHENTATGRDDFGIATKLNNVRAESELLRMCSTYDGDKSLLSDRARKMADKASKYCQGREDCLHNKRFFKCLFMIRFLDFYFAPKTYFGDLIAIAKSYKI